MKKNKHAIYWKPERSNLPFRYEVASLEGRGPQEDGGMANDCEGIRFYRKQLDSALKKEFERDEKEDVRTLAR